MDSNTFPKGESSLVSLRDILSTVISRVAELSESEEHLSGLSTGFSRIDRILHGLNNSNLILLTSRPSMGKTSLALNIVKNVAKISNKTVMFSRSRCQKNKLQCV